MTIKFLDYLLEVSQKEKDAHWKKFRDKFDASEYNNIRNWMQKYSREMFNNPSAALKRVLKFKGLPGIFCENKSYKLYRGILLSDREDRIDSYPLESLKKHKIFIDKNGFAFSWTKNLNQALRFAYGNKTWMGDKKSWSDVDRKFKKYGIVLEHTFQPSQIIFDFEYIEKYWHNFEVFQESEVIVAPKRGASYKVIKIL